jgi:sulfonate transport system ATP-binding protein
VSLARALVREPKLLLLDEPFSALDAFTKAHMQEMIISLWKRHKPIVLMVTHDLNEALLLADRILVLSDGYLRAEYKVTEPRPRIVSKVGLVQLREKIMREFDSH